MTRRSFLKGFGASLVAVGVGVVFGDKLITAVGKSLFIPCQEIRSISALTFSKVLKEYLPIELLRKDLMRGEHLFSKIVKEEYCKDATIQITFNFNKDENA